MEQKKSLFGPLFLIVAGSIWLLIKGEYIPGENLWALTHIWPYVLIIAGLGLILRNYSPYASIAVDVFLLGGVVLAIWLAPRFGWANPPLDHEFRFDNVYMGSGKPGSGNVIEQERKVSGFDAIEVNFPARVMISQGQTESVTVEAEDNFLPGLKTEVRNGVLDIHYKADSDERVNPTEPVILTIVVRDLRQVDFTTAGDLTINDVQADTLEISLSGAGNVKLIDLDTDSLSVDLSGAGNLTASGSTTSLDVNISGFGNFNGDDLKSSVVSVRLSGAGNATVWAEESLDVELSGAGSVSYFGDASVTRDISGLGGVKDLGDK